MTIVLVCRIIMLTAISKRKILLLLNPISFYLLAQVDKLVSHFPFAAFDCYCYENVVNTIKILITINSFKTVAQINLRLCYK